MELFLRGKRAIITGASKGIGKAVAFTLAEEGCDLILVSRTLADLEKVSAEIKSKHAVSVKVIAADLSKLSEVERVAQFAASELVNILVNNAGAIPAGDLLSIDSATWRSAWDLKVFGYIDLTRALYPVLRASGEGVIVNNIGNSGEKVGPGYICGSTGNAALMAFTRALGMQSPRNNIRVVGLNAGPVSTQRIEMLLRAQAKREKGNADRWQEAFSEWAFGRCATPEEIASAVAFLASPRSAYSSGTIMTLDDPMRRPM